MTKFIFSIAVLLVITGFAYAVDSTGPNYLFVINFDNGTYADGKLTLNGNGQSNVIYFSDKPQVESGHMGIKKFVTIWGEGEQNFNTIPPNSTLSIIKDEVETNSVFILSNPKVEGTAIIFDVERVHGKPTSNFEAGGLFLDTKLGDSNNGSEDK
ncbi:MAG: hypothetical protein DHS20C13_07230 [Thermodesulfobacteriota bacterium]|nr:MAG: hypothetical protein DHS20C13_07230 [Thermodesulfobacteriota bacterium]